MELIAVHVVERSTIGIRKDLAVKKQETMMENESKREDVISRMNSMS